MTITAHTLVKNEARFVWYAVMSVISHVDKVLLWDTGSTDETAEIIDEILKTPQGKKKVYFKKVENVTIDSFPMVRQAMLDETKTDWLLMVDGDEVWGEDSIKLMKETIEKNGTTLESIVVPTINLVGDIYHYQDPSMGMYNLAGRKGHLNLRGVNLSIPDLHSFGSHGQWGWVDKDNKMIQYRNPKKILYIDAPYLHATNVPRAGSFKKEHDVPKRSMKRKYELGISFPLDFYYPEVFFRPKPDIVPSPWEKIDAKFKLRATLETPLRKIKRKFVKKVGY
ncbi:MAG: glycosyltransferase [Patescibacteria group bacterium]